MSLPCRETAAFGAQQTGAVTAFSMPSQASARSGGENRPHRLESRTGSGRRSGSAPMRRAHQSMRAAHRHGAERSR